MDQAHARRHDRMFTWMDRNGDGAIDRDDMMRHKRSRDSDDD